MKHSKAILGFILLLVMDCKTGNNETKVYTKYKVSTETKGLRLNVPNIQTEDGKVVNEVRRAVIIGIGYDNLKTQNDDAVEFKALSSPKKEAIELGNLLKSKGNFNSILSMTDSLDEDSPNYPTKTNIINRIESTINSADPNDFVLLYFSGHGFSDGKEGNYLVPANPSLKSEDSLVDTSVSVDYILKKVKEKGLKKVILLLDACRDMKTQSATKNSRGLKLITKEYSDSSVAAVFYCNKQNTVCIIEGTGNNRYSVFTRFILDGIRKKGDKNGDTVVTFWELVDYVKASMEDWSQNKPPDEQQKPTLFTMREFVGDIPLSLTELPESKELLYITGMDGEAININQNTVTIGDSIVERDKVSVGSSSRVRYQFYSLRGTTIETFKGLPTNFYFSVWNDGNIHIYTEKSDMEIITGSDLQGKLFIIHTPEVVVAVPSSSQVRVIREPNSDKTNVQLSKGKLDLRVSLPNQLEFCTPEVLQKEGLQEVIHSKFELKEYKKEREEIPITSDFRDKLIDKKYKLKDKLYDNSLKNLCKY